VRGRRLAYFPALISRNVTNILDRMRELAGLFAIEVCGYLTVLDWTGRELRADKRGAIPDHLAPIVERLGLNRSSSVITRTTLGLASFQVRERGCAGRWLRPTSLWVFEFLKTYIVGR
jgi:hypothetical protein